MMIVFPIEIKVDISQHNLQTFYDIIIVRQSIRLPIYD